MTTSKQTNRRVALLLCALILLCGPLRTLADDAQPAITGTRSSSYQNQIDEINQKMADLQAQRKELERGIENAKGELEKEQATRSSIYENIRITQEEIAELEALIELQESYIVEKQETIEQKQGEIDESFELFLQRMRIMYMYDDATMLGLVLGSDSFSEFLTHTDTVLRVAQHDRDLMDYLTQQRLLLEAEKADLERTMEELEESRAETQNKKTGLDGQLAAVNLRIHDIEAMEREFTADLEKNQAMRAAMEAELEEIYRQIRWSENPYIGGEMAWPLPGYYQISSEYGSRFGGSNFHTGIDLTGGSVYGASIVAANAGTVQYVNWSYAPGVGYGIYVIVDHGGGVTTLYAHCSNIVVTVGTEVEKGQKIAEVGSTGWSTGPHLHFEVRLNGTHTNPKPYIIGG